MMPRARKRKTARRVRPVSPRVRSDRRLLAWGPVLENLLRRMTAEERRLARVQRVEKRWEALRDLTGERALALMAEWIHEQVEFFGAKGCVLGVSGGVDSTLCAIVLARALPADKVHPLVMPHRNADPADEADAIALLEALGLTPRVIRLDRGLDAILAALDLDPSEAPKRHVGNLAARARVGIEYYYASVTETLVVGTGDLDEVYIGFSSQGMGSDLYPITGLHKDEVRALAYLGLAPVDEALARRLADRPASPGYWPGQRSEEQIGLPYGRVGRVVDALQFCLMERRGVYPTDMDGFLGALEHARVTPDEVERVVDQLVRNYSLIGGSPALFRPEKARALAGLSGSGSTGARTSRRGG